MLCGKDQEEAMIRRRALLAAPLALPAAAQAQPAFPTRPVTLIVPFPAGGTTDVVMRALAEGAGRRLGQNVIVDNRPGAANTLGAQAVARARPDGYLLTQLPASAIRVQILQRLPYDSRRDFTPVIHVSGYTFGAIARADRFAGGWRDVVAEAKRRPGVITVGNTGANGTPHVAMMQLAEREGIEVVHVSFRGDADGVQALLGGHVDVMTGGSGIGGQVDGGRARWLHVWTPQRLRRWPDAPTLVELGHPEMVVTSPFGLVAPAGLDAEVTRRLHDAFAEAMREPGFVAALERFDMVADYRNTADYNAFLQRLVTQEEETIRRLNLTAS
jgi:tripartite-type tricarboxylate transporter receptor subunit TctC